MKICNKCKRELDESCFSIKRAAKDGLSTICKECKKEYDRLYDERKRQELKQNNIKVEKCCKCGKQIKYENLVDGQYVVSMFCKDCFPDQVFKDLTCEKCGKIFKVGRKTSKLNDFISRKYCPECSIMNQDKKELICPKCGKIYYAERTPDGRHFKHKRVCDECSKPATEKTICCERCGKSFTVIKYPGTDSFKKIRFCSDECRRIVIEPKTSFCECCGKELTLPQNKEGYFVFRQYCSKECRLKKQREKLKSKQAETIEKMKKTCQEKYGVDYPCQTEKCMKSNPMIVSKLNEKFSKFLLDNNIEHEYEFPLGPYHYDFHILDTNILVELNPTFTHTCFDTGVYDPRPKQYHHDKTKFALDNGYMCICVWGWDDWNSIINLLKTPNVALKETQIQLHYSKNKENIIVSKESDYYLEKGYLPVYDDGFKIKIIENKKP